MTRPMSEEERERALKAAAATVESYTAYDFGMSPANELLLARALLSTSAAVRGMREALEKIAEPMGSLRSWERGTHRRDIALQALAALSGIEPEDEQARGQGRSAPISTDTKGTTNG